LDWQEKVFDIEIKRAIFQMDPNNSPGSDGYDARSYQKNWEVIGPEVSKRVHSFFSLAGFSQITIFM